MSLETSLLLVIAVAFASNVSPFFGASYTLFATLQLSELGNTGWNFVLVVVASAIGATLAKVAIYYGAFGLRKVIDKNKNVQLIGRNSTRKAFYLVLFLTALLPILPLDDFIFIGAGATKASVRTMTGVTFGAKALKSGVEIPIEFTLLGGLGDAFGISNVGATLALGATFLVIGIVIYKVDWEKLAGRLRRDSKGKNIGP